MTITVDLDHVIRALHAVKRTVEQLETQQPVKGPRGVAASPDDSDRFTRIFGQTRGVYFKKELAHIESAVERISADLRRL
jgi:hypothetical protein